MPLDLSATVYAAVYGRIAAGVAAYNTACDTGGPLAGVCKAIAPLQALDDRTTGRLRAGIANSAGNDFPLVRLRISGGDEQRTTTPTFGLMQGVGCDAIVPVNVQLLEEIVFPVGDGDAAQTPLEAYIDAAYRASAFWPKLGIAYCNGFGTTSVRRVEQINKLSHVVRRKTINVRLRPHLSALQ